VTKKNEGTIRGRGRDATNDRPLRSHLREFQTTDQVSNPEGAIVRVSV